MSHNQDLHDERISKLYKMGGNPEPPVHIDDEIKRAARVDIPNRWRSYTWPSLATAAVLVLSFSLVLKVLEQKPLQETVMEPLPTEVGTITPSAALHESEEKAIEQGDRKELRLKQKSVARKLSAKKQGVAPATAQSETADTAEFAAAPPAVDAIKPANKRLLKRETISIGSNAAPAGHIEQEEAAAPEATMGEVKSSALQKLDCSGTTLPETDSREVWIKLHQNAMELGQLNTARCLKHAYQARFKQAMPIPPKQ